MLKRICVAVGLLLVLGGAAFASDDGSAAGSCAGPWLSRSQLDAVDADARGIDFQNIAGCIQQEIDAANVLLGHISDVTAFADDAAKQRDALGILKVKLTAAHDDIAGLIKQRDELKNQLAKCTADLSDAEAQVATLLEQIQKQSVELAAKDKTIAEQADRIATLEAENKTLRDQNALLQGQLADATARIDGLTAKINELNGEIDKLNSQIAGLQTGVDAANASLAAVQQQNAQLQADLDQANATLASVSCKVDRLANGRRLFFQNLSAALKQYGGIFVVDDRLVVQSELLFAVGSARVSGSGMPVIATIANAIKALSNDPQLKGVHWMVQINGHTDIQPVVFRKHFQDNWQLSTERALTVVRVLADRKGLAVDGTRLAAAGFGEFEPIDPARTPAAYARNRRIEFRLVDYDYPRDLKDDCASPTPAS